MDLSQALDIVVARTGNPRYRALCDPDHPAYDPAYVAHVFARAGAPLPSVASPGRPTVAQAWDLTRAMKACPYYSRRPGCCAGARCALRKGDVVSHIDCNLCIQKYG